MWAQVDQATILGTVRDAQQAVVPGARVTIRNLSTNLTVVARTASDGSYRSVPLRAGEYSVTAESQGFRRTVREGVEVVIQQQAVVDLELQVGELAQEVTVSGAAPPLQVTEASRGEVIGGKRILDMPLNGRNYLQLALFASGTNIPPPDARGGGFSSGGLRASHNNFLLDGVDNNNYQHAGTSNSLEVIRPSVDAIQEFKVQTSSYSAEFGRGLGATVNVSLKSGGNAFHGGAYEFWRDASLSARNFFAAGKPAYKRNQFGGTLGGPIRRDRLFFFANYEQNRIRTADTALSTVPTVLEKAGNFSQSILANRAVAVYDPATYTAASGVRSPFAGNLVPASRQDAVGRAFLNLYPTPNRPGLVNNFLYNPLNNENVRQFNTRVDYNLSSRDALFGRFSMSKYDKEGGVGGLLPAPAYGGSTGPMSFLNDAYSGVVSYSRILTTTLVNTARFGYSYLDTVRGAPTVQNLNAEYGLSGLPDAPGLAAISVTGFRALGHTGFSLPQSETKQFTDDVIWNRGRHAVRAGANIMRADIPQIHARQSKGVLAFDTSFTRRTLTSTADGYSLADLLLGMANRAEGSGIYEGSKYRHITAGYVQDDWKATPRLMLNFGVRWEYNSPWFEANNRLANFDVDTDPATAKIVLGQPGSVENRTTLRPDWNNWAPRLGLAWQLNSATVIRSGYGIFFGASDHTGDRYLDSAPPFNATAILTTDRITPAVKLDRGYPAGFTTTALRDAQMVSVSRDNPTSYAQQWNFTIQRQLPWQLVMDIAYAGTKGVHLLNRLDANQPVPGPGAINSRRPYRSTMVPGISYPVSLADIYRREWNGNSNYHGLDFRIEKRLSAGLSLLASYGWSKAISDSRSGELAGGTSPQGGPQNVRDIRAERSLADEHRAHKFVTSFNYDLPFGLGRAKPLSGAAGLMLGGWSAGGIWAMSSGQMVNVSSTGNPSNSGSSDRPNRVSEPNLPSNERSLSRWFNTSSFVLNAPFTFGNSPRNPVFGPSLMNLDLGIFKTFRVRERLELQFRCELFNATNTPYFGPPGASAGTSTFGVINSASDARITQLALKLLF
jgi:hypothetical protein